jgi:rod shape-determining protein MreD
VVLHDSSTIAAQVARMGYFALDTAMPSDRRREGYRLALGLSPLRTDRPLMSLLLAAIGATVSAVLEVTLAGYLKVGNANPHPVLVLAVIWTIAVGIDGGVVWAFVGGLALDALTSRPLGATAFTLLVVVGATRLIDQPFGRLRVIAPVVVVPILSLVGSLLLMLLTASAGSRPPADPLGLYVPGAVYDGVLALILGPLIVSAHDRRQAVERVDW